MKLHNKLILISLMLNLVIFTVGCGKFFDNDDYSKIQGHITLANTKIGDEFRLASIQTEGIESSVTSLSQDQHVKDEILVRFKSNTGINYLLEKYSLSIKKEIDSLKIKVLTGIGTRDIKLLVEKLNQEDSIEYAELNEVVKVMATNPQDTYYNYQWNYPATSLPQAWDITQGSEGVTVAVIDTGVDLDHPDLQGQFLRDEAGDIVGRDFIDGDNLSNDENGHGTHVAGIIGASTNNGLGVAGVNWNISIMPVRVLNYIGEGSTDIIAQGIRWAVDHGANIINLSLGSIKPSEILKEAINYAYDHGVTIVAASGNNANDQLLYPAHYKQTISVGAIDSNLTKASFSNYGDNLDFVAPGENIPSTVPPFDKYEGDYYVYMSGTSMATPHVSGVAALTLAEFRAKGQDLTPDQLKKQLRLTAQDLGVKGWDLKYGSGLINAHAAVADAQITKVKVFAGERSKDTIKLKSDIVGVTTGGAYSLSGLDSDSYYLYGWLDLNENDTIDKGDYFGKTSNLAGSGVSVSFSISLIRDDNFTNLKVN